MKDETREQQALKALGERIRNLRQETAMTQADLAFKVDTPQQYISKIEKGSHSPSFSLLLAIADALNISPAELIDIESLKQKNRS